VNLDLCAPTPHCRRFGWLHLILREFGLIFEFSTQTAGLFLSAVRAQKELQRPPQHDHCEMAKIISEHEKSSFQFLRNELVLLAAWIQLRGVDPMKTIEKAQWHIDDVSVIDACLRIPETQSM
jgi:hypothetical protein